MPPDVLNAALHAVTSVRFLGVSVLTAAVAVFPCSGHSPNVERKISAIFLTDPQMKTKFTNYHNTQEYTYSPTGLPAMNPEHYLKLLIQPSPTRTFLTTCKQVLICIYINLCEFSLVLSTLIFQWSKRRY